MGPNQRYTGTFFSKAQAGCSLAMTQVKLLQEELEKVSQSPSPAPAVATPAVVPQPQGHESVAPVGAALGAEEREKLRAANRELQSQVALRERELQVFHWRSQAESNSLKAQESLMASCFHELGLRYHQLQVQNELLQKRLRGEATEETTE